MGPQAPGWDAAAAALKGAKTDTSKPVRDAAAGALPLVAELLEFAASGAPLDQWPAVCGSLLAVEAGGGKQRAVAGARAKMAAAGRADEGAPPNQLIPAVRPTMAPPPAAGSPFVAAPLAGPVMGPPPMAPPPFMPAAASPGHHPFAMAPPPAAVPVFASPMSTAGSTAMPQDSGQLAAQLALIQQQQAAMAAALASFTISTQSTLQQLQLHLSSVSAGVAALAAGSSGSQAQAIQAHLASVNAGMAALAMGVGGAQQALASAGVGSAAAAMNGAASGSPGSGAAALCPKRLSSLHRSYNALEQDLLVKQQQSACPPGSPTGGPASPSAVAFIAGYGPEPHAAPAAPAAPDWEAAYSQLLGTSGGIVTDQQAQLKLLRCIARSGPVWEQLSPGTGQRLMQAITAFLQVST